jgi:Flp pilus assembly protein TadG
MKFIDNKNGNILILSVLAIGALLAMAALVMDSARAYYWKSRMQMASDAAAMACALSFINKDSKNIDYAKTAKRYYEANLPADVTGDVSINVNEGEEECTVISRYKMKASLSKLAFQRDTIQPAVQSVAKIVLAGTMEIVFVLDETGSMINDIGALKYAAQNSLSFLKNVRGAEENFSIGGIGYSTSVRHQSALEPGVANNQVRNLIQKLEADGATNIIDPVLLATEFVKNFQGKAEKRAHTELLILMTDGQHNSGGSESEVLSACKEFKNGNKNRFIITVGLGGNLDNDLLLGCASSAKYYYKAEDQKALVSSYEKLMKKIIADRMLWGQLTK